VYKTQYNVEVAQFSPHRRLFANVKNYLRLADCEHTTLSWLIAEINGYIGAADVTRHVDGGGCNEILKYDAENSGIK